MAAAQSPRLPVDVGSQVGEGSTPDLAGRSEGAVFSGATRPGRVEPPRAHEVDRCVALAEVKPLPQVIGLDLSAESTGVALPDGSTYVIKAPKAAGKKRTLSDDLHRLDHVATIVEIELKQRRPALAVIEDYAPGIRSAAAHRLAEIGGVVRLACRRTKTRIALVNPTHLKIYATGNSRAEKRDMALAAYKRAGLEFPTDDECDAFWLRAMGLDHLGHPLFALPKSQRDALAKVAWPRSLEFNPETHS